MALFAVPATAQIVDNDDGPAMSGGMLSTPVTEGRSWSASLRLNTLYDTNFRRTSGPDQESAVRMSPAVTLAAGMPVGRQQLFVSGNYGRDFTLGNPDFNRSRWKIGGGAGWRLGARCSGVIGAETGQRLNLVFDQAEFSNNVRRNTAFSATANCTNGTGLGVGGSVGRVIATNDRPEQKIFDVTTMQYAANLFYGNETIGQFSLGGTLSDSQYANRLLITPDGITEEGFRSLSTRLGYSRGLGSRLQITAGISYNKVDPKPDSFLQFLPDGTIILVPRGSFSGNGYDLSLNYTVSTRMSVNLVASRSVRANPNVGARFTISTAFGGTLNYDLGPSLSFSTGANYRTADYKDAFASPDEPVPRVRDEFVRLFGSLNYSPGGFYNVGFQVAHQRRRSDPEVYNFNNTTAILTLSVNFGSKG